MVHGKRERSVSKKKAKAYTTKPVIALLLKRSRDKPQLKWLLCDRLFYNGWVWHFYCLPCDAAIPHWVNVRGGRGGEISRTNTGKTRNYFIVKFIKINEKLLIKPNFAGINFKDISSHFWSKNFFCIFRPKWPLGLSLWREHAFQRLSPWPLRGKNFFLLKMCFESFWATFNFSSIFLIYHKKFDNKNSLSSRFSFTRNRPPLTKEIHLTGWKNMHLGENHLFDHLLTFWCGSEFLLEFCRWPDQPQFPVSCPDRRLSCRIWRPNWHLKMRSRIDYRTEEKSHHHWKLTLPHLSGKVAEASGPGMQEMLERFLIGFGSEVVAFGAGLFRQVGSLRKEEQLVVSPDGVEAVLLLGHPGQSGRYGH